MRQRQVTHRLTKHYKLQRLYSRKLRHPSLMGSGVKCLPIRYGLPLV